MSFSFRYKKKDKYYLIWLSLIMLIIFYSFFFQYGVYPINHAMMALSALIILFTFIYIIFIKKYRIIRGYFNTILLFVFTSVIVGVFISGGQYGIDIGIRMIEYALTSYALFTLLVVKPYLLTKILWSAFVSITLLAITVLIKGTEVTSTGAIGLENLNVNEMSSYFIFMVFCSLILFANSKKKAEKGILIFADIVVILAQIGTASRRGFLVMLAVFLGSMIFAVIPYFSKENSRKKIVLYYLMFIILAILLLVFRDYVMEFTVLGERLQGIGNNGDSARRRYQAYAIEQFKSHPFLGIGIGGIAHYIGIYSHSLYYEILSCTGVVGSAILFMGILQIGFSLLKSSRILCKKRYMDKVSYSSCIGGIYLVGIIVSGISVVMIYDFYFYISISVLAALAVINEKNYN